MIYKLLYYKFSKYFKFTLYLLLFSFIISLSGCVSTETASVTEKSEPLNNNYKIISIILKDKSEIIVKDLHPKLIHNAKGQYTGIVYYLKDTSVVTDSVKNNNKIQKKFDFKDISSVKIEITESHTVTIIIGVFIGLALIALILSTRIGFYTQ